MADNNNNNIENPNNIDNLDLARKRCHTAIFLAIVEAALGTVEAAVGRQQQDIRVIKNGVKTVGDGVQSIHAIVDSPNVELDHVAQRGQRLGAVLVRLHDERVWQFCWRKAMDFGNRAWVLFVRPRVLEVWARIQQWHGVEA